MTDKLDRLARIEIRLALIDLNNAFTHHLDHNNVEQLVDLFAEDALYTHGARRSEGRVAIAELFCNRTAAGPRTARHMSTGLQLNIDSAVRAMGASVCMTFAQDGEPPIGSTVPYLVADFDDVYRLIEGRWYIQERHITRIFVAPNNTGPVDQN